MALDGITVAAICAQCRDELTGGRISKITQPEADELILQVHTPAGQKRLLLSASPSLPLLYLNAPAKNAPLTAPSFCMLLRKHIAGGRIVSVTQPGLERVIHFEIEHLNEMKDPVRKLLIIELMGKHSNIIFCDESLTILDSIRRVSASVSSVREVLPGRKYFLPETVKKEDPLELDKGRFLSVLSENGAPLGKAIYRSLTGISPLMAEELCYRSKADPALSAADTPEETAIRLYGEIAAVSELIRSGAFSPRIWYRGGEPAEYAALPLYMLQDLEEKRFDDISSLIQVFYEEKEAAARIRQRSSDIRRIVATALERARKKLILQETQMKDAEKADELRLYGELLQVYASSIPEAAKEAAVLNYYTGEEVRIPLDAQKSAMENASRYFDRYQKMKRTRAAMEIQQQETSEEIGYLESVEHALAMAQGEEDLDEIKEELRSAGILRQSAGKKIRNRKSEPLCFLSGDGLKIYVGKNNLQNEQISFKLAQGNDWWFHAKQMPGSHVIVKANGTDVPESTFEEAARLAAHYSSGSSSEKVEVDYTQKKYLKKPNGARPGYVIYHKNYSMLAPTDIDGIKRIE